MIKDKVRYFYIGLAVIIAWLVVGAFLPSVEAQDLNYAGVVMRFGEAGDAEILTYCVPFTESMLSGYELLSRTGLDIVASEGKLCALNGVGCPADNCFCQCPGGTSCVYWSYWHLVDGRWQYSVLGSHSYAVQPGAVDGWLWAKSGADNADLLPQISFTDICTVTQQPTGTVLLPTPTPYKIYLPGTQRHWSLKSLW
ncbi:MAG: hypothetical protein JW981_04200 [Anaerolineae bacterium]|nr:hypothetical protein [Anaerolineae bacterium]